MDADVAKRVLGLLGLGARGRRVVVGVQLVREAARRGELVLAVIAPTQFGEGYSAARRAGCTYY